jgi:hypothetical protein
MIVSMVRRTQPDRSLITENFALTSVMMSRALGVELSDDQLMLAFALLDEAEGHRKRRARRTIAHLAPRLSERQRSLAVALPIFWYDLHNLRIHVITADHRRAEQDADLYRAINERTGTGRAVDLFVPGQSAEDHSDPGITIGSLDTFTTSRISGDVAVLRVSAKVHGHPVVVWLPEDNKGAAPGLA